MSITASTTQTTVRRDDAECQTAAGEYLRELIGAAPDDLVWDVDHHLQGHARCAGREIIVIAGRDAQHCTLVLTPQDWDGIRRTSGPERGDMLRACAIVTHRLFLEMFAA